MSLEKFQPFFFLLPSQCVCVSAWRRKLHETSKLTRNRFHILKKCNKSFRINCQPLKPIFKWLFANLFPTGFISPLHGAYDSEENSLWYYKLCLLHLFLTIRIYPDKWRMGLWMLRESFNLCFNISVYCLNSATWKHSICVNNYQYEYFPEKNVDLLLLREWNQQYLTLPGWSTPKTSKRHAYISIIIFSIVYYHTCHFVPCHIRTYPKLWYQTCKDPRLLLAWRNVILMMNDENPSAIRLIIWD